MKANKFGIPVILVLLLIFVPAAIYGVYYGGVLKKEAGNPSHQKKLDGKLYFYDSSNTLLGFYTCQNDNCDEATSHVDDENDFGYEFAATPIGLIGEGNAFVQDGETIYYIMLKGTEGSQTTGEFSLVKDYAGRLPSIIIVKTKEGKYGIYDKASGGQILGFEYDFIGVNTQFDQTKFVTMQNGKYNITTNEGVNTLTPSSTPIHDFDSLYIYYYDPGRGAYLIRNGEGNMVLPEYTIKSYRRNDQLFAGITDTGMIVYNASLDTQYKVYEGTVSDVAMEGTTITFNLDGKSKTFSLDGES